MAVLLVTSNLATVSRVQGAAGAAAVSTAMSPTVAVERAQECHPRLVVIDLATPGLDMPALVSGLRGVLAGDARVLAFGPHVQEGRLAAAREAGCDVVLTNGQFHSQLDQLLGGA